MKVRSIEGTITLEDGSMSYFIFSDYYGWQQWGARTERLGATVDVMEALSSGLAEGEIPFEDDYSDYDEDEDSHGASSTLLPKA